MLEKWQKCWLGCRSSFKVSFRWHPLTLTGKKKNESTTFYKSWILVHTECQLWKWFNEFFCSLNYLPPSTWAWLKYQCVLFWKSNFFSSQESFVDILHLLLNHYSSDSFHNTNLWEKKVLDGRNSITWSAQNRLLDIIIFFKVSSCI